MDISSFEPFLLDRAQIFPSFQDSGKDSLRIALLIIFKSRLEIRYLTSFNSLLLIKSWPVAVDELRVFMWFIILISFTVESFTEKEVWRGLVEVLRVSFIFWILLGKNSANSLAISWGWFIVTFFLRIVIGSENKGSLPLSSSNFRQAFLESLIFSLHLRSTQI